jgi:predicted metal-dependent enzyme (double-stranded beta helix superfamily)
MSALATETQAPGQDLLRVCRAAVATGNEIEIAGILKSGLFKLARAGGLHAAGYPEPAADRYARRLAYADPWGRFVVIAMTWGPGHKTALHDHAGVWCVEVVVDGEMEVVNYELVEEAAAGRCRFKQRETVPAPPASSGALIPPFEHHVFRNAGRGLAHTLHVYGGPMNRCNVFEPLGGGWFQRIHRELRYDA